MVVFDELRAARLDAGLSQRALGQAIGRSDGWVCRLEAGTYDSLFRKLEEIARVLDRHPKDLFTFSDYPDHPCACHDSGSWP